MHHTLGQKDPVSTEKRHTYQYPHKKTQAINNNTACQWLKSAHESYTAKETIYDRCVYPYSKKNIRHKLITKVTTYGLNRPNIPPKRQQPI